MGPVTVVVGAREAVLSWDQPVPVDPGEEPTLVLGVRCACGADVPVQAPITFLVHDDDHVAYFDLWFTAQVSATCPACGAGLRATLGFTVRRHRLDDRRTLAWDGRQG